MLTGTIQVLGSLWNFEVPMASVHEKVSKNF